MAGMFSMLSNNYVRGEGGTNAPANSAREEATGGRSTPRLRPSIAKQTYLLDGSRKYKQERMKSSNGVDMGKLKCSFQIHPALRRSVCALIIAITLVLSGMVVFLIEFYLFHVQISIAGVVLMSSGILMVIIGLPWYYFSRQKLETWLERWELARMKKIEVVAKKFENTEFLPLTLMTAKHVAKWPTRKNCDIDKCKETITSPNGNHYITPAHSWYSDSDDVSISSEGTSTLLPEEDQRKTKKPVSSSYRDFIESTQFPIMIDVKDALSAASKHYANDVTETSLRESNSVTSSLPRIYTSHY